MKRLLTIVVALAVALGAYPAFAAVLNSPHDFQGVSSYGLCDTCHVPHAAKGSSRLWAQTPASGADLTTAGIAGSWASTPKGVGLLCANCHVLTFAAGNKAGLGGQNMALYAYNANSHGNDWGKLTGDLGHAVGAVTGKPYTGSGQMECSSCHNPHDQSLRPFLRPAAVSTVSDFCADCHSDRLTTTVDGTTGNHPVNVSYQNDAGATNHNGAFKDVGAVTYAAPTGSIATAGFGTNAGALIGWTLGGKFQTPTGQAIAGAGLSPITVGGTYAIGCQTCHAVHSPQADAKNAGYQGLYLLAIANGGNGGTSALCEACHAKTNPTTGSRWANVVGAEVDGIATNKGDHPIDGTISAAALSTFVTDWTPALRQRSERIPAGVTNVWPRGGTGDDQIMCTSCHSAHKAGNRLRRAGGDATEWCKSCHPTVSPLAHHSHSANGGTPACGQCHGGGPISYAHNNFAYYTLGGDNTALCLSCHGGGTTDPVEQVGGGAPNAAAQHLGTTITGAMSHYIGAFDTNAKGVGINVKTGYWQNTSPLVDSKGNRRDFSKY